MILQELFKLAQRENLLDDTAFEERGISFVVRIDAQGRYVALESLLDERGKPRRFLAPKMPVRTVAVASAFAVDNAQYTLRMAKNGKQGNADARASAFDTLIGTAFAETGDAGLAALSAFLGDRGAALDGIRADAPAKPGKKGQPDVPYEWNGDEMIGFALAGDTERIDERPAVASWWRSRRSAFSSEEGGTHERCLVTGERAARSTEPHSKVKNIPNGNTTGTSLVSCNAAAFKTHGLTDTDPISAEGAEAYVRALNWLLEGVGEGKTRRRFRQGVPLDSGSVVVFWTRESNRVVDELIDLGVGLFGADAETTAEDARALVESPRSGVQREHTDATALFALTLSGNAARVVVRDWFTSTAGEIKTSLGHWFRDLAVAGADGRPLSIRTLLESLQARPGAKDKGELPPDCAARLFHAAIADAPVPEVVLLAAIRRFRIVDKDFAKARLAARAALIRCALNRRNRRDNEWKEITVALDPTATSPGYVLGRLFAVLEHLQIKAAGQERELNATIRDRYFGAASTTPAAVFPRLLSLSVHHASKLGPEGRWLERQKEEVIDLLPARAMPAVLDLDQQGLFSIGYYHQRHERFRPREKGGSAAANDEGTTAP